MSSIAQRLAERGITLAIAAPVAAYVPAVRAGSMVYTSGQLPVVEGALAGTGKVGAQVTTEQAAHYAHIAVTNALAAAADLVDLESVAQVVKLTVYVASDPAFTDQALVANGASTLLEEIFQTKGRHARAAVGVAVLPLDAPVEVDLILALDAAASPSS